MMPASVQRAWWHGNGGARQDPSNVDSILQKLDGVAASAR